jgi:uncharacterized protein
MKSLISLLVVLFSFLSFAQLEEKWHASMSVMGMSERLMIKLTEEKADLFFTDRDTTKPHKLDDVVMTDSSLTFTWKAGGLKYHGVYFMEGDSLFGEMSQAGMKWNVSFHRKLQEKILINRPQEPKEPFSYTTREVIINNGDVTLGATITIPHVPENQVFPIVVLASGSGPQDRNCELLGHKPFLVIADHLAKNGIATLRFDDRGVGQSTGSFQEASLEDFASDVLACVSFIQKDPLLKNRVKIGAAGHSEGGMHVLMAAKKNKKIAFVIELASVGTSGKEVLIEQQYLIPLKNGGSQEYADWNKNLYSGMSRIVLKYDQEKAQTPLINFLDSMYAIAPQEVKEQSNIINFKIGMNMFMNTTWMRQFLAFEAADYLKKLKIPILAINGSEDIQVPAESALDGFDWNLSKRSRVQSKLIWEEGLNHLFQKCFACTVMEYGDLEETINVKVLDAMTEWIKGLK